MRALRFFAFLFCGLSSISCERAHALEPDHEHLPNGASLSIDEVLKARGWESQQGPISHGYTDSAQWFRIRAPRDPEFEIFSIDNPWLFRFDVYMTRKGKVVDHYTSGSLTPYNERPIAGSSFAFPMPDDIEYVYILATPSASVTFPTQFLSVLDYSSFNAQLNTFHGFYYGIIAIMILYNLALFVGTKDKAYFFYSLYATSLAFFLATSDGTGAMFLWPDTPEVHAVAVVLGWGGAMVFLLEFMVRFLHIAKHVPKGVTVVQTAQGLVIACSLLSLLLPNPTTYTILILATFVGLGLMFALTLMCMQRRVAGANIFFAANTVMMFSACVVAFVLMTWTTPSVTLQHALHFGSLLELSILSLALVQRLRESERARYDALQRSSELVRRNKELAASKGLAEEHRQLQKSLQQAQKLKTIGQLAGGFAHDFNNILASILGFAELAQVKSAEVDRQKQHRYLAEIQKAGQRGASLVKQLLVYSRNTPPQPQRLNLSETLLEAHNFLRGSLPATATIETRVPEQPTYLYIDPEQLQQMLVNLCINAAEAMNNRGDITITLKNTMQPETSCTSCLAPISGDYVAITVEDNGRGIQGNARNLFTPFETSKEIGQGTGLGLSVVHGIVHEHGGHIHAANRAEGGARFTLYIPSGDPLLGAEQNRKHILLIEDDANVARYLEELLSTDEFETTVAHLPTEALETFVENPDNFDLVIANYLMPQGTGIELAEDLHEVRPDLPILLTSGNSNNFDPQQLANAGIKGVFEKPLDSDHLVAKVRALLTKS